jgi:demethylmenaquinone methyltransferase/2-methoxy-6-polyprenyl-1,4-benzoquinol methylase
MVEKTRYPLQVYYTRIYRTYDLVNRLFTFGLDKKWRNFTVKKCLSLTPRKVLDLCCGTGDLAISLSMKASRDIYVAGYDLNKEMLGIARRKAEKSGVSPVFIQGEAADMPFKNEDFDCITIGFGFRNLTWQNQDRDRHILEIRRVLKSGGYLLILESSKPENKVLARLYSLYLNYALVPIGGMLSGDWNAYRYLAGSSDDFFSFGQLKNLLGQFGFELSISRKFLFGSANLLIARKLFNE